MKDSKKVEALHTIEHSNGIRRAIDENPKDGAKIASTVANIVIDLECKLNEVIRKYGERLDKLESQPEKHKHEWIKEPYLQDGDRYKKNTVVLTCTVCGECEHEDNVKDPSPKPQPEERKDRAKSMARFFGGASKIWKERYNHGKDPSPKKECDIPNCPTHPREKECEHK